MAHGSFSHPQVRPPPSVPQEADSPPESLSSLASHVTVPTGESARDQRAGGESGGYVFPFPALPRIVPLTVTVSLSLCALVVALPTRPLLPRLQLQAPEG